MNEQKKNRSALVNLNEFSFTRSACCFFPPKSAYSQLGEYYKTKKNNSRVYKEKIRYKSSNNQENLLFINGKKYKIEHNFDREEKSEQKKRIKNDKDRKTHYLSGGTAVVKKLISCDEGSLLRLKCFDLDACTNIYNNIRKTADKYLLSVNIHKNIFKRHNTAFYMRDKSGKMPKFYMVMDNLGDHDLQKDIKEVNNEFYYDKETLLVRVNIARQILEQIQMLFDNNLRWLDPKIENVIVRYNFDRSACRAEITDFDSIIKEKKSKWLRRYTPTITYMPKSREEDFRGFLKNPLQYSMNQLFDRGYVISVLSLTVSRLFPTFIQQEPETMKFDNYERKNFLIPLPMLKKFENNNKNKESKKQIFKVICDMYRCAKTEKSNNKINLKEFIKQLKIIEQQLSPPDADIDIHNHSDDADNKSNNLTMSSRYYRVKLIVSIGFIGIFLWNLLNQSCKDLIGHAAFKTSGIVAYIATAVFCLMLCVCIILHKNKLQKESWCTIFGLISAAIGCILLSQLYSEQAFVCFLAAVLLLATARQFRHLSNPKRKSCTSFGTLLILVQLFTIGTLFSANLLYSDASKLYWTICALGLGMLAAFTIAVKDVFNEKKSGVNYLPTLCFCTQNI